MLCPPSHPKAGFHSHTLNFLMALVHIHGFVGLTGQAIDDIARSVIELDRVKDPRCTLTFSPPYYVTVITKAELQSLSSDASSILSDAVQPNEVDSRHVFSLGVGAKAKIGVYFVVIIWAAGQVLRKRLGLPPKQFHITLSASDDHDADKGVDSLLPGEFPEMPSVDLLDHLAFTLHVEGRYEGARQFATQLCLISPHSERGYLRLGDAAFKQGLYKLSMLAFARAFRYCANPKIRDYCVKKIAECSNQTEWGCIFSEEEYAQLPAGLSRTLCAVWSTELCTLLSKSNGTPSLCRESGVQTFVPSHNTRNPNVMLYRLPRFFRWLVPFTFALMSSPKDAANIEALASPYIGIRHILTLTEEEPLHPQWFEGQKVRNTFLPVPNYKSPSVEQMDVIMRLFQDQDNLPILVHCGGGKGRAGTVAACYLVAYGFARPSMETTLPTMSANEAIHALRTIRPGSIETTQQEEFVALYCSTLWKRQSILPDLISEPPPCPLEVEGKLPAVGDLFIFVGLPGAGKSWLARALLARDPKTWTYISQDETGSRATCENAIGRARGRVILDRCNTSAEDRKVWLSLASHWSSAPVCVWFDYDRGLCTSRAQARSGHPTLPPGSRVRNAVEQMDKAFMRPGFQEGFKAIVIIRSFAAAEELVERLSSAVTIVKFPRTPHILNLGAATDDDVILATPSVPTSDHVVITEKVDGANMGFSLSSDRSRILVQNRSHYISTSSHEQFKKLGLWVDEHFDALKKVLGRDPYFAQRYILYGEWLVATHSIAYTRLPDRFLAFDLYDRSADKWVDRRSLENILHATGIRLVPVLYEGPMPDEHDLRGFVQRPSLYYDGPVEGVYVKTEKNGMVIARGKVVRSDFIAGNEHWTKGPLQLNTFAEFPWD